VHRVQRVPETEAQGRIHTSAATVAVLPEAEEVDIDIPASDIRIDTMRSLGRGRAACEHHRLGGADHPYADGIVVTSSEKSQHRNRKSRCRCCARGCMRRSASGCIPNARRTGRRRSGRGIAVERIRTYNFPQGRMTDHRINLTLYALPQIMGGDLTEVIDALTAHDQAERLAEMEG
jgi:peptide chain release factor 1